VARALLSSKASIGGSWEEDAARRAEEGEWSRRRRSKRKNSRSESRGP
jgi:hypothetical protein